MTKDINKLIKDKLDSISNKNIKFKSDYIELFKLIALTYDDKKIKDYIDYMNTSNYILEADIYKLIKLIAENIVKN